MFSPLCTAKVWLPRYVPSLITSLHHNAIDKISVIKAKNRNVWKLLNPCIVNTPLVVNVNKLREVNKGQGDGDTK
jgi:hypothetical protein